MSSVKIGTEFLHTNCKKHTFHITLYQTAILAQIAGATSLSELLMSKLKYQYQREMQDIFFKNKICDNSIV